MAKMAKRSFSVISITKPGQSQDKTKSHPGRFISKSAAGAAKKAFTQACRAKQIFGQCALIITMRETTEKSAKKEFKYQLRRVKLENPLIVKRGNSEVKIEYETKIKTIFYSPDVNKTRTQNRGRRANSVESCANQSYFKSHDSDLKICPTMKTCKKVKGEIGKRCILKKKFAANLRAKTLKKKVAKIAPRTQAKTTLKRQRSNTTTSPKKKRKIVAPIDFQPPVALRTRAKTSKVASNPGIGSDNELDFRPVTAAKTLKRKRSNSSPLVKKKSKIALPKAQSPVAMRTRAKTLKRQRSNTSTTTSTSQKKKSKIEKPKTLIPVAMRTRAATRKQQLEKQARETADIAKKLAAARAEGARLKKLANSNSKEKKD